MVASKIDAETRRILKASFAEIEQHLKSDVLVYYGTILERVEFHIKKIVEEIPGQGNIRSSVLYIILTTDGGSLNPVKRIVDIVRHHYEEVYFIVPDYAYSAGTILCASGDGIYMSYFSALGPIDPQVLTKDNKMVSALGYLDKVQEMLDKARLNTLTDAEFIILKDFDLAELRDYEQAKALATDLLTTWLPKYKFKNWETHKDGSKVTYDEKVKRATEIAEALGDNNRWKSHGRPINIEELRDLKLQIDDLKEDSILYGLVMNYHDLMIDYIGKYQLPLFIQTRRVL